MNTAAVRPSDSESLASALPIHRPSQDVLPQKHTEYSIHHVKSNMMNNDMIFHYISCIQYVRIYNTIICQCVQALSHERYPFPTC